MTAIGPKECPNAVKDRIGKGGFVGHGVACCVSLPDPVCLMASIVQKRPERNRDRSILLQPLPPMSGKLSAALLFLYFLGGRDRMMIWDIHRNEKRLC